MKNVAIIDVGEYGTSGKDVYADLMKFLNRIFKMVGVESEILENPSKIRDCHTHVLFISDGMCDIASGVQEENPEKKVVLLITGGSSERPCLKNVIPIRKGKDGIVSSLVEAIR